MVMEKRDQRKTRKRKRKRKRKRRRRRRRRKPVVTSITTSWALAEH